MMSIQQSVVSIFQQLEDALIQLENEQYSKKITILSEATLGQHVRHVVEMFVCLQDGYLTGTVNYEKRKRDMIIETSKDAAIALMQDIKSALYMDNKALVLEAGFDENSYALHRIPTNYFREIAYNLEHAIHHMALIKIGFRQISSLRLPENFGVATSTIKYRQTEGARNLM